MTATTSEAGRPAGPRPTYEPPALLVLGSVARLTLGATGSVMDQSGRAAHGRIKP